MSVTPEQVDTVFLERWADAVAFREALGEFEARLDAGLEAAVDLVRPWLEQLGYGFVEVQTKYARINVARQTWVERKSKQPCVWFTLDAVFPYGYRKVNEDFPLVWVVTKNLEKEARATFQTQLASQVKGREGDWINEWCDRDYPLGHYIESKDDLERLTLALAPEALASFVRDSFTPILAFGDDVDAALRATLGT
jgi:hypothetical protein